MGSAEDAYRRAVALAAELGMRPLVAHCHLGLGRLYRRADKRPSALDHLRAATAMFREMEMPWWLDATEQEGKLLTPSP